MPSTAAALPAATLLKPPTDETLQVGKNKETLQKTTSGEQGNSGGDTSGDVSPSSTHSKTPSIDSKSVDSTSTEEENTLAEPTPGCPVMASKYVEVRHSEAEVHNPKLNLDSLRKSLPKEVFVKSLRRSLQWMIWDMGRGCGKFEEGLGEDWGDSGYGPYHMVRGVVCCGLLLSKYIYESADFSLPVKLAVLPIVIFVTGFFQWCVFVSGHDCGHGSFSEYKEVNFVCGLISHGSILVPFTPWARSHRLHHQYHNHVDNDYSHPWNHDPKYDPWFVKYFNEHPDKKPYQVGVYPFVSYIWYLLVPQEYGGVDGSHYLPGVFSGDRLWHGCDREEMVRSWISVFAVVGWMKVVWIDWFYAGCYTEFFLLFAPSWYIFCLFLYTVTYLQHHSPNTKIYDNSSWRYSTAAFETVDRTYGKWIDFLHHHISDCHVVHHIYFTKIPHYNLRQATDAMVEWLEREDVQLGHLYQLDKTLDFLPRMFVYMYQFGTRAKLITCDRGYIGDLLTGSGGNSGGKKEEKKRV